jgi:hypothetical protein
MFFVDPVFFLREAHDRKAALNEEKQGIGSERSGDLDVSHKNLNPNIESEDASVKPQT